MTKDREKVDVVNRETGCLGCFVAAFLSWIANKSILWAILHFFVGWLYVVYWFIFRSPLYDWLSKNFQ
jgi:hypothetical protein